MLKELEEALQSHQKQITDLKKEVSIIKAKTSGVQKLTYTVKEASAATGLKETTLRSWINDGSLKATQTGKNYLIPVDALLELLNCNK